MFDNLTLSCTEVLWVDGRVQDSVPQSVAVPVDTKIDPSVSQQAAQYE